MELAVKNTYQVESQVVTKKEFEKGFIELMDRVRIIDQKLSTKADEVVFTITMTHRQEIEELQFEIIRLNNELKKVKKQQTHYFIPRYRATSLKKNPFKKWFK
ncbi:hypothetical protein GH741_07060 [Aquibacillus halophilus]|uniref:Uncharacterized protein n=1 Tax=Aquibacillus halophilus TaxID=930132 RepID=A0A6A8DMH6_9BACI|nr:hypothetical protein [Aquibacillus halophilus]MRH42442.1 hypothetical protein [Aquibacillus halophilus]